MTSRPAVRGALGPRSDPRQQPGLGLRRSAAARRRRRHGRPRRRRRRQQGGHRRPGAPGRRRPLRRHAARRCASAVFDGSEHLREVIRESPQLEGMGTTLTAILFAGGRLALCHVGDSRAYLVRDGQLAQITHDDTFVQTLIDDGRITAEEANSHPQRSLLLRALNGQDVEPDLSMREARAGDRYLLCSDGLSGVVSDETIAEALRDPDPQATADRLIELALRSGGPDNITVHRGRRRRRRRQRSPDGPGRRRRRRGQRGQREVDPRSAAGRAALADPRPRHRRRRRTAVGRWPRPPAAARCASSLVAVVRRRRARRPARSAPTPGRCSHWFVGVDGRRATSRSASSAGSTSPSSAWTSTGWTRATDLAVTDLTPAARSRVGGGIRPTTRGRRRADPRQRCASSGCPLCRDHRGRAHRRTTPTRADAPPRRRRRPGRDRRTGAPPARRHRRTTTAPDARPRRRRRPPGRRTPGRGLPSGEAGGPPGGRARWPARAPTRGSRTGVHRPAHPARHRAGAARLRRASSPLAAQCIVDLTITGSLRPEIATFGVWFTALWAGRAPRRAQVRALRRPAAAALRRAAHRPGPGRDPPAGPRRRAARRARSPARTPRSSCCGPRSAWCCSSPCCWWSATTGRCPGYAYTLGAGRPGAAGHPGGAARVDLRGQRREDLDPGGRASPSSPVSSPRSAWSSSSPPTWSTSATCSPWPAAGCWAWSCPAGPRPRPGAAGLGAVDPGAGLRARPGQLAAAVRHLRRDALRRHRAGRAGCSSACCCSPPAPPSPTRSSATSRPRVDTWLDPFAYQRRRRLPAGPVAVRPGHRRAVRRRPRRRAPRPGAGRQERLHRRGDRRGAGPVRPGRRDRRSTWCWSSAACAPRWSCATPSASCWPPAWPSPWPGRCSSSSAGSPGCCR